MLKKIPEQCLKQTNKWSRTGIHGPPDPGTDRSDLVRDFLNFVGPGPARSEIFKFFLVLALFGPKFSVGFGPWIPGPELIHPCFSIFVG